MLSQVNKLRIGPIKAREMKARDLDQVMEIERACFPAPWARKHFLRELELDYGYHRVAEAEVGGDKVIIGYIVAWLVQGEFSILNVAVRRDFRGHGIGRNFISNALSFARRKGAETVWLDVRPSNQAALSLYDKFEFKVVGRRVNYYTDSGEDALVMVLPLE